ncbi:hypothetical protein [Kordia jejudonensis]|uniref:hypothetical protein n=1 Tax=Kordia jejudonensis TaxID=1348245 RepID=UPI00187D8F1C|nr:hypothetical protein [Kordia jejudonensis]
MSARKIIEGVTKTPRAGTINILVDLLCNKYNVSRIWLVEGTGDIYMKKDEDCYLEKHGVRFSLDELIQHFLDNQETYLSRSSTMRLEIIDNIVRNKDYYLEISEYFKLFIRSEIEKETDNKIENLAGDIERKLYIKYLEDTKDYLTVSDKIEVLSDELERLKKEIKGSKANNSSS